jgi:hypothetical protein
MEGEPEWTARRCYNSVPGQLTVEEVAVTVPFSTVERSMQRQSPYRPPLPATRQNLVLAAQYSSTINGRPFVLVDDGQADRILVFGTSENLAS